MYDSAQTLCNENFDSIEEKCIYGFHVAQVPIIPKMIINSSFSKLFDALFIEIRLYFNQNEVIQSLKNQDNIVSKHFKNLRSFSLLLLISSKNSADYPVSREGGADYKYRNNSDSLKKELKIQDVIFEKIQGKYQNSQRFLISFSRHINDEILILADKIINDLRSEFESLVKESINNPNSEMNEEKYEFFSTFVKIFALRGIKGGRNLSIESLISSDTIEYMIKKGNDFDFALIAHSIFVEGQHEIKHDNLSLTKLKSGYIDEFKTRVEHNMSFAYGNIVLNLLDRLPQKDPIFEKQPATENAKLIQNLISIIEESLKKKIKLHFSKEKFSIRIVKESELDKYSIYRIFDSQNLYRNDLFAYSFGSNNIYEISLNQLSEFASFGLSKNQLNKELWRQLSELFGDSSKLLSGLSFESFSTLTRVLSDPQITTNQIFNNFQSVINFNKI